MADIYGVQMNIKGVKAVMREQGVRDELLRRAGRVATAANNGSPVDSGELSQSHEAYMDERPDAHLPAARVGSTAQHALIVEARTGYLSASLDAARGGDA